MKWGLFTCGYQLGSLEKAFSDAASFGYDYIELWGGRPHAYAPDLLQGKAAQVRGLSDAYGIPIKVYTPEHNAYPFNYMLCEGKQWDDCMAYLSASVRACGALGAARMVISAGHGGNAPLEQRRKKLILSLAALADTAAREGCVLLLETLTPYESNTCTKLDELADVIDAVGSPYLMAVCDVVSPFSQGEDPAGYIRKLGSKTGHVHFADNDGISDAHLIPGDGIMPLSKIISDMRLAGYDGTVTIELVTRYMGNPSEAAHLAIKRAKLL